MQWDDHPFSRVGIRRLQRAVKDGKKLVEEKDRRLAEPLKAASQAMFSELKNTMDPLISTAKAKCKHSATNAQTKAGTMAEPARTKIAAAKETTTSTFHERMLKSDFDQEASNIDALITEIEGLIQQRIDNGITTPLPP
jgi:hypothetical protein